MLCCATGRCEAFLLEPSVGIGAVLNQGGERRQEARGQEPLDHVGAVIMNTHVHCEYTPVVDRVSVCVVKFVTHTRVFRRG